jgi:hypothetical protein
MNPFLSFVGIHRPANLVKKLLLFVDSNAGWLRLRSMNQPNADIFKTLKPEAERL